MSRAAVIRGLVAAALSAALLGLPGDALGTEDDFAFPSDFLGPLYSTEPGCASGRSEIETEEHTFLTADSLFAIEYLCEFLDYKGVPDTDAFVAITACSAPGELTPELILVRRLDPVEDRSTAGPATEVGVIYQGARETETVFHLCPAE